MYHQNVTITHQKEETTTSETLTKEEMITNEKLTFHRDIQVCFGQFKFCV